MPATPPAASQGSRPWFRGGDLCPSHREVSQCDGTSAVHSPDTNVLQTHRGYAMSLTSDGFTQKSSGFVRVNESKLSSMTPFPSDTPRCQPAPLTPAAPGGVCCAGSCPPAPHDSRAEPHGSDRRTAGGGDAVGTRGCRRARRARCPRAGAVGQVLMEAGGCWGEELERDGFSTRRRSTGKRCFVPLGAKLMRRKQGLP